MDNDKIQSELLSGFEKIDKAISKPISMVSTVLMGVAVVLLFVHIFFNLPTNYISLQLMVLSIGLNICGRYADRKARRVLMDVIGLTCQNCGKTPEPASIYQGSRLNRCPHCHIRRESWTR